MEVVFSDFAVGISVHEITLIFYVAMIGLCVLEVD